MRSREICEVDSRTCSKMERSESHEARRLIFSKTRSPVRNPSTLSRVSTMAKKQQKPTAASKPNILARLGPKGGQASDGRPVKSSQRSGYGFGGAGSGSTSSLAAGRIITVGGSGHPATTGYSTYAGHNAPKPKTLNDRYALSSEWMHQYP